MTDEQDNPVAPGSGDPEPPKPAPADEPATADSESSSGTGGLTFPESYDPSFNRDAYAAVPEIGSLWWRRWYDLPYQLLTWWAYSRFGRMLPQRWRKQITRWRFLLIRFNEHDLNKARRLDDPMHNLFVPQDEQVTVPTLWVIELFPPSAADELDAIFRKHRPSVHMSATEHDAAALLSQMRAGQSYDWVSLGAVEVPGSLRFPDARREEIAEMFWGVELTAIRLGTGLTAVLAQFRLTDEGAASLNEEWHRQHEPRLRRSGTDLTADDRQWAAFSGTQRARRQAHDAARNWMRRNCPGRFAQSSEPQPLIDLLVLEEHDPTGTDRPNPQEQDALRALGLTQLHRRVVSPVVHGVAISKTDLHMCPTLKTERTWALWCNRSVAIAARPGVTDWAGSNEFDALAHTLDHEIREVLLALSVTALVELMQRQFTSLRDTARRQHDSFSPRYLLNLRQTLLTLSIDLASIKIDVPAWWERRRPLMPTFYVEFPRDTDDSRTFEFTQRLRSGQYDSLVELSERDSTIRDILSTVASLGAASDTHKISRTALSVARISLFVAAVTLALAVVTLLATNVGSDSVWAHVKPWLQDLWTSVRHWWSIVTS